MALVEIRQALETHLNALTPSISTAWENIAFTPVNGTPYQRVNLVIADTQNPTMGDSHYRLVGFMQVTLCYPINGGAKTASQRADLLVNHFKRGVDLSPVSSIKTLIHKTPKIEAPMIDGDRYKLPVSIYFSTDIFPT